MLTNPGALGDLLLRKYITDFVVQMQSVGPMFGAMVAPVRTQYLSKGIKKTAGLVFKETRFSKWGLWEPLEEETTDYATVIGHQCRRFGKIALMSLYPGHPEECYNCAEPVPDRIVGLWKLHNYDIYSQLKEN